MATIDLSEVSVREANDRIREFGAAGEAVDIVNPDARHHIGVGLVHGIKVNIKGSAGYFCAGLTDGAHFEIDNNVGWGLADNMLSGSVVVRGNASAIAGVAIRGADVVVRGNVGSRAGQVMKSGTLLCGGNANFMAGYMMYGGRIIILGNSGDQVGQDMTGGTIYVGGRIETLGTDAAQIDLPSAEEDEIRQFLDRFEIPFGGKLTKIVNAGKTLRYTRTEPRIRSLPFFTASGDSEYWNEKVQEDIRVKASLGRYRIRGYGTSRPVPHFSDIGFRKDIGEITADPKVTEKVDLATELGGRHGGKALKLSMPVMIAPMSYGALSKSTKLAHATASRLSGISENTGEGGMMDEQRAEADQLVYQCLSGRLGWSIHDMQRADALEIYVSQGAKPGLGGQLMAKKVTPEIARIRGIPEGIDLRSPSRHPDVLGADDLVIKIEEFREATGYKVPVSVKLGAGRVRDDIKIAYKDGFDYVSLDGLQGSTGAAGNEVLEFVGIPTLSAIQEAMDALEEVGGRDEMPIVLMGGIKSGVDVAKALALGAHAVAVGTSALIAGGCISCLQCHAGSCVVGIATQDPEHEKRYNISREAQNIHAYLESLRWQIAAVTRALGYDNPHHISRDDLVALTPEAAEITGLPYVPEGQGSAGADDAHFVPAPCQVACPVGTDAPSYIAHAWEGRFEEAFEAITATNPLSSICGRVCDAPCEPACRRADSDGPVAIRNIKRYVMDELGADNEPSPVSVSREESVGIVGGGPAGLAAAQELSEAGFKAHIYELTDRLGGMAAWGIPSFRLPDGVIAEDIDRLLRRFPGIKVHLNTALGRDVALDELKSRHDAVLLSIGAWQGKDMAGLDGAGEGTVINGVDFLRRVNGGERPEMPETVVVVGGGDVAMDACRSALRLPGCKSVKVVYRRGTDEIPARGEELEGAKAEGVEFDFHVQPVAARTEADGVVLTCIKTEPGEPDADGRCRPVDIAGSEHDIACGLVIVAVGQQAENEELGNLGLMAGDRVATDWAGMRTADPQVFAAGDGAFGGSTIVMAMQHGQRAAYYIQAFLDDVENPAPYRTPHKTRRVEVAQDPEWETLGRRNQKFLGLGQIPADFPEIEQTYDARSLREEAARCFRCDAETGSADYTVRTREDIFAMAQTDAADAEEQKTLLDARLVQRGDPFGKDHQATLEDLVFLPANLSRLVIDPYRDPCNVGTTIGGTIKLATPFLVSGFDEAPEDVRSGLGTGLKAEGAAYVGRRALLSDVPWLQLVSPQSAELDPSAAGHVYVFDDGFQPFDIRRNDGASVGMAVNRAGLAAAIPFALEHGIEMLLLDGSPGIGGAWPELAGTPDISVMREAIAILRGMNREEDIELIYFGGVRSGTDLAKLIGLGANAAVLSAAMAFALGGGVEAGTIRFDGGMSADEHAEAASLLLKSLTGEASIMARCTGKTNVHNIEPEDLRSISVATAEASGIPVAIG